MSPAMGESRGFLKKSVQLVFCPRVFHRHHIWGVKCFASASVCIVGDIIELQKSTILLLFYVERMFSAREMLENTRKKQSQSEKNNENTIAFWLHNIYTKSISGAKWCKVEPKTTKNYEDGGKCSDQCDRYL